MGFISCVSMVLGGGLEERKIAGGGLDRERTDRALPLLVYVAISLTVEIDRTAKHGCRRALQGIDRALVYVFITTPSVKFMTVSHLTLLAPTLPVHPIPI